MPVYEIQYASTNRFCFFVYNSNNNVLYYITGFYCSSHSQICEPLTLSHVAEKLPFIWSYHAVWPCFKFHLNESTKLVSKPRMVVCNKSWCTCDPLTHKHTHTLAYKIQRFSSWILTFFLTNDYHGFIFIRNLLAFAHFQLCLLYSSIAAWNRGS